MAGVRNVQFDITKNSDDAMGTIHLTLDFSDDDLNRNQHYELYTALVEQHKGIDQIISSPLYEEVRSDGSVITDDEVVSWAISKEIKPQGQSSISLTIEDIKYLGKSLKETSVYRAIVYLIPKVRTEIAWSTEMAYINY